MKFRLLTIGSDLKCTTPKFEPNHFYNAYQSSLSSIIIIILYISHLCLCWTVETFLLRNLSYFSPTRITSLFEIWRKINRLKRGPYR